MSAAAANLTPLNIATIDAIVSLFETNAPARYGAVARSATDAGGLSYGKHQAALVGGHLFQLISQYCSTPAAAQADALRPYLDRMQASDRSLDHDDALVAILKQAASDPVMQDVQDDFFKAHYMDPALAEAQRCGFQTALGCAVIYDSFIQGSWSSGANIKGRTIVAHGEPTSENERVWVAGYLQTRRSWLLSRGADLARSVYRIDALNSLVAAGFWDLELPLAIPMTGFTFNLSAWDLNAHLFHDPVFRVEPERFGVVKARHAYVAEGRDRHVQQLLSIIGLVDPKVGVDGKFGTGAANAFRSFQLSCNAPQTGVIDGDGYLLLCDAVRRVQGAQTPTLGAALADLKPLPQAPPTNRSRVLSASAGASVVAAGATVAVTEVVSPKQDVVTATGLAPNPPPTVSTVSPAAPPAISQTPPGGPAPAGGAPSPAVQLGVPSNPPAPTTSTVERTTTAQVPPAPPTGTPPPSAVAAVTRTQNLVASVPAIPDWRDGVQAYLPWVAVGFLVLALALFILARRRAY